MKFNTNINMGRAYAVPLREIHEIEFTSRCNLACKYCPHPKMLRAKADMTQAVFDRTMLHLNHLCLTGTQGEVSLTGIGEAILHPQFVEWMREVRRVIGSTRKLVIATNGVAMTQDLADEMARQGAIVYVSAHRPEKAGPAVEMLRRAQCMHGLNSAFVDSAFDWAGQVSWHVSAEVNGCAYLQKGWGAVRQDGSVNTCCMDAESLHPIGHVLNHIGSLQTFPTAICADCHLVVPPTFCKGGAYAPELIDFVRARESARATAMNKETV